MTVAKIFSPGFSVMSNRSVLARVVCFLSMIVVCPLQADLGRLTINGVEIPENLYHGMYKGKDYCPPTSNVRYRQRLVGAALIVFAGREGNFELTTADRKRIAEATSELERAESRGNTDAIAKAAWKLFYEENSVYGSYLYPSVSTLFDREDVLNEYRRLVVVNDPRVTDVVTGRYAQLTFPDAEQAQLAIDLINSGKSLADLTSAIDEFKLFPHNMAGWSIAEKVRGFSGDSRQLQSGMAVLATEGHMWYSSEERFVLYFDEVLTRSRLRPFTEYNNNDDYAYDIARYNLWDGVHHERKVKRWEDADIREDGEPVTLLEEYPECP